MVGSLKYRLICEGPSEYVYVQRLMAQTENQLPLMDDGFSPRLKFFPYKTNEGIGGGSFKLVKAAYRKVWPRDRNIPLHIWVDCDIYIRKGSQQERANAIGYEQKGTMPDFNFMVMNYEDFLAMHFPDELFGAWKSVMNTAGHFRIPLYGDDYKPLFKGIWSKYLGQTSWDDAYSKGSLPEDFVTVDSLRNMIRHCDDPDLRLLFHRYAPAGAFPLFLAKQLRAVYPELFG